MSRHPLEVWRELGANAPETGTSQLRLEAGGALDLFAILNMPHRHVGLRLLVPRGEMPSRANFRDTQAFKIRVTQSDGNTVITILLEEQHFRHIFAEMCWDVARHVAEASAPREAVTRMANRIAAWRDLFAGNRPTLLRENQQIGLYGELLLLEALVGHGKLTPEQALASWKGPFDDPHDFHFEKARVEVKTTTYQNRRPVRISSLEQLTPVDELPLFLWIECVQWGGVEGRTLAELVRDLGQRFGPDGSLLRIEFERKLAHVGYFQGDEEQYDNIEAAATRPVALCVEADFPCLNVHNVPSVITEAGYHLNALEISPKYSRPYETVLALCDSVP